MTTDTDILIDEFLKQDDVRETTKGKYRNMLRLWCNWLIINGISWGEVRKPHVIKFRDDLKKQEKSSLYINILLCILNKFYDYLQEANLYPMNIAANVKKLEGYKGFKKEPLTADQAEALIKSIDTTTVTGKRDILIIKLMLISGLRCVEVSRLDTEDINLDKIPYINVLGKGKTNKVKVGLSDEVARDLKKYVGKRMDKTDEPVFLVWEKAHSSERMSATYIGIMIKARMISAGINDKKISAHSLRHTCAVQMIRNDNSLYDVQITLRHTSSNMTQNYLRYIEEERRFQLRLPNQLEKFYKTKQIQINYENNLQHSREML